MAEEIRAMAASGLSAGRQSLGTRVVAEVWRFAGRRKVEARRMWRRATRRTAGTPADPG
jgi:hypothetical protein